MKFEFKKNKNGTVDIMYKSNDITINLHGTAQEVEIAYRNMHYNYLGNDTPSYSELDKCTNYSYELPDVVEETEESDDEHIKTYREDFEERFPKSLIKHHCVNELYYDTKGCRCTSISCNECWNRELGT